MVYPDWKQMPEPLLLWFNTFILFLSSLIFINVQIASKKNDFKKVKKQLLFIGALAFIFLVGQLLVWQQFINAGYYVSTNPANAYFYVFTSLHGIHLLGGLIYWNLALQKVWLIENIVVLKTQHTVELCSIYWHFLLIVWLVLFGLMIFS